MTLVCHSCKEPIEADDYHLDPAGEPVHAECHSEAWDDREPPAEKYLDPAKVASNFEDYCTALEQEADLMEEMIDALEAGEIDTSEIMAVLPTPTPLEAWQADTWAEDRFGDVTLGLDTREAGNAAE